MATQWWREPWRKLFLKLDAKWLGLSVSARGLADELIKYADADGRLFQVASQAEAGKEIAIRLSAKPREYKRIAEDTAELLRDTYLVIADGWLLIRNFINAQERLSPEARRQRAKRERDKERDASRDDDRDENVTAPRDSHRESIRSDSNREEKTHTRAHAHVDETTMRVSLPVLWAAWKNAGLGPMQDGAGMLELLRAFNADDCEADPMSWCAAWRRITVAWRKKMPTTGEGPLLMLRHMDKVHLVVTGQMEPEAVQHGAGVARAGGDQINRPPRQRVEDLRYKDGS